MSTHTIRILFSLPYESVREECHALKDGDMSSLSADRIREGLIEAIPDRSILIPVPGRDGKATFTKQMVNTIIALLESCRSEKTVFSANILQGKQRDSVCEWKRLGLPIDEIDFGFFVDKENLAVLRSLEKAGWKPILVDNVIDTGTTVRAIMDTIGEYPVIAIGDTGEWEKR